MHLLCTQVTKAGFFLYGDPMFIDAFCKTRRGRHPGQTCSCWQRPGASIGQALSTGRRPLPNLEEEAPALHRRLSGGPQEAL